MPTASDLRVVSLPALEEQLVASRHEEEVAHLRGFIVVEDCEWVVLAGIWQGASVALVAMQLRTGMNLHRMTPGFLEHAGQEERTA